MPDGTTLDAAKLRGVESQRDDPGRGRARDRHRPRRDPRARRGRAASRARRSPSVLPIATDVLELEITPNRPDCLGDLRRRAGGPRRHRRAARAAPVERGSRDAEASSRASAITVECPGAVPALHRARVRGREDRPEPAVAEGAPDGRRPAPDLERRRHHQLRDAADRPAAARVRPRPRRRRAAHRPAGARPARRWRRSTGRRATLDRGDGADRRRAKARPRSPG